MTNEEAKQLLIKYNEGRCTAAERLLLEDWYLDYHEYDIDIPSKRIEEIGEEIYDDLPIHHKVRKEIKLWPKIIAVAAMLLLTVSIWLFLNNPKQVETTLLVHDVSPGGNKAILTLSDGRKINLIGSKSGVNISNHKISYLDGEDIHEENETTNSGTQTLTTPRGGQYQIVLPDGTKVWLNAASSLTYPISFAGKKDRRVTLTGEAYFDVEKMKGAKMPFIVTASSTSTNSQVQEVKVFGTHFNINTYNPISFKTTLLEGSVNVSALHQKGVRLSPGEQSVFTKKQIKVHRIDPDLEVAWKDGKTAFESADINTVMLLLTHWYDIEVKYEGKVTDARFSGSVSRSRNISAVLKLLESTNDVHFKIKGREITVMN